LRGRLVFWDLLRGIIIIDFFVLYIFSFVLIWKDPHRNVGVFYALTYYF
jgi:hypothetical protein